MVLLTLATASLARAQFVAGLTPATDRAFAEYASSMEGNMAFRPRFANPKPGSVVIAPSEKNGLIFIEDGMIHDWAAATFAKGVSPEQVLRVLQNYGEYKNVYAPDVIESRVLAHEGNHWHAFLRIVKKKALAVVLNSEYDFEYRPLDGGRWAVISRSTRIVEVDGERESGPDARHGFLWRLNAYWLIEPRPDGVYLECRTLSLTRDIPAGLGWMLRPIISSLPRESLQNTLLATIRAVH